MPYVVHRATLGLFLCITLWTTACEDATERAPATTPECSAAADCDDGLACTVDSCTPAGTCAHVAAAAETACDDGLPCTLGDHCAAGVCVARDLRDCDDGVACTADRCDADGACTHVPSDAACGDDVTCTKDRCDATLGCLHVTDDALCDDAVACTSDRCDATRGCLQAPDDALCDDDLDCTDDACAPGRGCLHTAVDVRCDDGDPCTSDACDPAVGCRNPALSGVACSDGNPCTADDTCANGTCESGPGACGCLADADCPTPSDPCVGRMVCDVAGTGGAHHTCQIDPASVIVCDPATATACQVPTCDRASGGCVPTALADGTACSDGDPCTVGDACHAGACVAGVGVCTCTADADCPQPASLCDGWAYCDEEGRAGPPHTCQLETIFACEDDTCLDAVCDPETETCRAVGTKPEGARCDDHDPCTRDDRCVQGMCTGGLEDPCDDENPCTYDTCNPSGGVCGHAPLSGLGCDDQDPCTAEDACDAGVCRGSASPEGHPCADAPPCGTATCRSGACVRADLPDGAACDDGNPCTTRDVCEDGACQAGTLQDRGQCSTPCTLGRCTAGICAPDRFLSVEKPCATASGVAGFCDGAGGCVPLARGCDDGNPCTDDALLPTGDCRSTPREGSCDDGNECTSGDACVAGACVGRRGACPCAVDADCLAYREEGRYESMPVCDADGGLAGIPGNCIAETPVNTCAPWPGGPPEGVEAYEHAEPQTWYAPWPCSYAIDSDSELFRDLRAIYRAAAVSYARPDRLDAEGSPVGHAFPAAQAATPVEETCCGALGGPDNDWDDRCDQTFQYFDTPTWAALGFRNSYPILPNLDWPEEWMPEATAMVHEHTYAFTPEPGGFTLALEDDMDCTEPCRHHIALAVQGNPQSGTLAMPSAVVHSVVGSCAESARALGPIMFTNAQRHALADGPFPDSLNPYFAEAEASLARLVEGAVAHYERQAAGECAFPSAPVWPVEATCCAALGGNDADYDLLCDAWPEPDPTWDRGWLDVGFALVGEFAFAYELRVAETPGGPRFEARAYGDLDCDTIQSTFVRFARPVAGASGCDAEVVPGLYVEWENE